MALSLYGRSPPGTSKPNRDYALTLAPLWLVAMLVSATLLAGIHLVDSQPAPSTPTHGTRCGPAAPFCAGSNCQSMSAFDERFCPDCSCLGEVEAAATPVPCMLRSAAEGSRAHSSNNSHLPPVPHLVPSPPLPPTPRAPCTSLAALLDGAYEVPCVDCARAATCTWTAARWRPRTCALRPLPAGMGYPELPAHSTLLFLGDSTLRGVYQALLQGAHAPPMPPETFHNNHSALLHDDVLVLFRYYPPWEEIRNDAASVATFPPFSARFNPQPEDSADTWVPQAADFLLQLQPLFRERLAHHRDAHVLVVHGGIMLRSAWVDDVRLLVDLGLLHKSSSSSSGTAAAGGAVSHQSAPLAGHRVQHVFIANGPRGGRLCGQYHDPLSATDASTENDDVMARYVLQQPRDLAWFPRCPLLLPLYPHLVRGDKCLCHFHWEAGHSGRVLGPGVGEQLRVLLYAWRHDLFPRGSGTAAAAAFRRLLTDEERFRLEELGAGETQSEQEAG